MTKRLLSAAFVSLGFVLAAQSPASAQSGNCCGFSGAYAIGSYYPTSDKSRFIEVCDSNKNTPKEAIECKLKYWRDTVAEREKTVADDQKMLDEARDRVRAFEAAKVP